MKNGEVFRRGYELKNITKSPVGNGVLSRFKTEGLTKPKAGDVFNVSQLFIIVKQLDGTFKPNEVNNENTFVDETTGESVHYSLREEAEPEKTIVAYKAFYARDGKLYPPMVSNPTEEGDKQKVSKAVSNTMKGLDTPVGVWLNADIGGLAIDKETGEPERAKTTGRLRVANDKGGGSLAYRPGWHLGEWPDAKQFNKDGPDGKKANMPDELVFAKCLISADVDYQLEALQLGVSEKGGFDRTQAGLPYLPKDGFYKYRTNANPDMAPWYISGAMKIVEILDDDDCEKICSQYGIKIDKRVSQKKIDLEALGLKHGPVTPTENVERYKENNRNRENKELLEKSLKDERYAEAYRPRSLDFNNQTLLKEFEIDRITPEQVEEYRKNYKGTKYSVSEEDTVYDSMTMDDAKKMLEKVFAINGIRSFYDNKYRNADEWIRAEGAEDAAMYVENTYEVQDQYLSKIKAYMDGDITMDEILQAYVDGKLKTTKEITERKDIDISKDVKVSDKRFYAPRKIEEAKEKLQIAKQKVTNANREEVYNARADILLYAHNKGAAETLGLTESELNKMLRSWSGYSKNAIETSKRINSNASDANRWTGIENLSTINKIRITNEQVERMVKQITGNADEYKKKAITRTMLALDTHIDWSWLTVDFTDEILDGRKTVRGLYSDNQRRVRVRTNYQNTVAHEMGHALDWQWGRELGLNTRATDNGSYVIKRINGDIKTWYQNFTNFIDKISDQAHALNSYTLSRDEVFARFVDRFCRWTDSVATGIEARDEYGD